MASYTSNLNLKKPALTDDALVTDLNDNSDKLDAAISAGSGAIAIVSVGNTHAAISSGQYVYVRQHGSLSEGLYKATTNIAANGTLSGSNLTAVSGGGLNSVYSALSDQIANYKNYLYTAYSNNWVDSLSVNLPKQGAYLFASQRYAQMAILVRFQNGNTTYSSISGSNWTFTNGTNGNITATASNQADYYIIPLIPTM